MKKSFLILFLLFSICFGFSADENCKIYSNDADSLFINTISAINQSKEFKISEIQSKNGYILFLYNSKYYLLTLTRRYQNQTEIKILPQNSDYSDGSYVPQTVFSLIDAQLKLHLMEQIK